MAAAAQNTQQKNRANDHRRLLIASAAQAFMPFAMQMPGKAQRTTALDSVF